MCYIGDIIERDITRFLLTKQIKKCTKCGIIGKHNKHNGRKDKLQTKCAACDNKAVKARYEEKRDAILAYHKEYKSRPEMLLKQPLRVQKNIAPNERVHECFVFARAPAKLV